MIITPDVRCSIFFGDASTNTVSHKDEAFNDCCDALRARLNLKNLVTQYQVHGVEGWLIDSPNHLASPVMHNERKGDFLLTNQPGVGIGVITADCLPIVFYVPQHNLVGVAHAGWRGSVAGIGCKVLENISQGYDLDLSKVKVYFGPSARSCCYEVQYDFLHALPVEAEQFIIHREGNYFFDSSAFNKQQLIQYGILPENIDDHYNLCTICNHQFCSYRRATDKEKYKTQTSVVWIS